MQDNRVKHGEMCLSLSDSQAGGVVRLQRCSQTDSQQVGLLPAVLTACFLMSTARVLDNAQTAVFTSAKKCSVRPNFVSPA